MKITSAREKAAVSLICAMSGLAVWAVSMAVGAAACNRNGIFLIAVSLAQMGAAAFTAVNFFRKPGGSCLWTSVVWLLLVCFFEESMTNKADDGPTRLVILSVFVFVLLLVVLFRRNAPVSAQPPAKPVPRKGNAPAVRKGALKVNAQVPLLRISIPWLWYELVPRHDGILTCIQKRGLFTERAAYPVKNIYSISSDSYIGINGVGNITFMLNFTTYITWKNVPKAILDQI